ncbi:MAG TPA: TetR/AcrR family transcriptional regulator, partial [Candidatus Lustribacter sp.]|nr:TetR/AcrR family transcriptional regulator [Candidatus Lustribacter sp.]
SWVYDKYATVFVQWGQIGSADTTLGPVVTGFVERYSLRLAQRLVEAGMPEGEASEIAGALLVFVNRVHYYRHVGAVRPMPEDEVIDSLALIVQLMLFPTTPLDVLRTIEVTPSPRRARVARPITLDLLRFEGLSARANRTVDRLLHAGSRQFVEVGYSRSTVEDVVIRAEVARGTFYKYFNDKLDLLTVLADEAGQALPTFAERLHDALHADDRHASLRACLRDFEPVHARYAGVLRAWIEQQPDDAHVTAVGQEVKRRWAEAFDSALYSVERGYALDLNVASLMLLAILERTFDGLPQLTAFGELNRLVELAATLIERGLLNPGSVAAA